MGGATSAGCVLGLQGSQRPGRFMETSEIRKMRASWDAAACTRLCFALCLGVALWALPLTAQQRSQSLDDKYPENPTRHETAPSRSAKLERLPIHLSIA